VASIPYLPQAGSLIIPDGLVGEEATELLQEFLHPRPPHGTEQEPTSDDTNDERASRGNLPWWKRSSPTWLVILCTPTSDRLIVVRYRLLVALPLTAISMTATMAPRIEIYTILACRVHKPEYTMHLAPSNLFRLPPSDTDSGLLNSKLTPGPWTSPLIPINIASQWELAHIYFSSLPETANDTESEIENRCASDPDVQAAVARLTAGMYYWFSEMFCHPTPAEKHHSIYFVGETEFLDAIHIRY
jgi:hypothetical protein